MNQAAANADSIVARPAFRREFFNSLSHERTFATAGPSDIGD
jgi:hypothetical protein